MRLTTIAAMSLTLFTLSATAWVAPTRAQFREQLIQVKPQPPSLGIRRAPHDAPCSETLDEKSYDCLVTDSISTLFNSPVCFSFSSAGGTLSAGLFGSFSCLCSAEGTVTMPEFSDSANFDCVGSAFSSDGPVMDFHGHASKRTGRITEGRFNYVGLINGLFECVERATSCDSASTAADDSTADAYYEALRTPR